MDNLVVKIAYYDTTLSKCTSYRTNIYIYIYIYIYVCMYVYIYVYYIYIGLINIVNMDWENFLKSQIIEEGGFYSSYGGARPYS